jgi:hypothetical protein
MKLLMRDGLVNVEFSPDLTVHQYEELVGIVQRFSIRATAGDLRDDVQEAAKQWGVAVTFSRPPRE